MKYLVCLLEEPSAKEMLKGILPKILPDGIDIHYVVFQGKQDLEKQVERRLKGWQKPHSVFLVMRDKDAGNCALIKQQLLEKVNASGKGHISLVRIACSELESFYLGDLSAVEQGLNLRNIAKKQDERKYRTPDALSNASQELYLLTGKAYQKLAGSRAIAPHLKMDGSNCSTSFNVLLSGITTLIGKLAERDI